VLAVTAVPPFAASTHDIDEAIFHVANAFSVTVVGLLIGAVAFGLSLSRDRMYSQDLSDLEYLAAVISDPRLTPEAT